MSSETRLYIFTTVRIEARFYGMVTIWGHKLLKLSAIINRVICSKISSMPLWIKLSNVPESYWTDEGLSWLASVVGQPVVADSLTSKLEMVPFAKMCVNCDFGDPLPNEILANALDPVTEETYVTNVYVTYPVRPRSCEACKSLGHSSSAFPLVKRVWVLINKDYISGTNTAPKSMTNALDEAQSAGQSDLNAEKAGGGWTIKRKARAPSSPAEDISPTPLRTLKNLKLVDEIDSKRAELHPDSFEEGNSDQSKGLSKSQLKKLKLKQKQQLSPPHPLLNRPNLMEIDFCSYNMRGLHDKIAFYKDFFSVNKISLVALLEAHVKKEKASFVSSLISPQFQCLFNHEYHHNVVTMVYAYNEVVNRRALWADLARVNSLNSFNGKNSTMVHNGRAFYLVDCNLDTPLMRKLDRILVNEKWLEVYDLSTAHFLNRGLSDDCPAVVNLGIIRERIFKPFQLFHLILEDENFLPTIETAWRVHIFGDL
ncbi:uncharacterized protein LOC141692474 [Apium graveolens]|uniref:uncharacterized protein LOC141692474 n=1 Tax=Apium graveolens TaxID=4045 RepID=UPI003D7B30B3